ncbi:hypothetical protein [Persicitalea jodogahamensis]|uniref:Lipocalin-like domain-containing protein n=1 Tax=Persicitalea jodogahamensis TaxID=402147 RepID=A0A8J3D404_9BACT|nr:hypothetical protein [Persicitalea jodogahamensis]GHB71269.1 hypothetical protein GCM10007390_26320 [Persicitalea jodogahamensis]
MKSFVFLFFIGFVLVSCFGPPEGYDAGGPITQYLHGRWKLEKVVTPSGTKTGFQIGYIEIIETGNNGEGNYDKVFRNDSLIATYEWLRTPYSASTSNMTVTLSYVGWVTRHIRIRRGPDRTTLETTGYVSEIGSAEDSVRYHYVRTE